MLIRGACFLIHVFFGPIICLIREERGAICIGITRFWEHQLEVVIEEVFLGQTKLPTPALNLKNNSYRYNNIHKHLSLAHAFNTEAKVPLPSVSAATHGSKGSAAHWCAAASPGTRLHQAASTWQQPRPRLCWTSLHNSINRMMLITSASLESAEDRIVRQLTDDGDVAQVLVPGNVLEHLEALCDRQIDLSQDDVDLAALVVENIDHLPRRLCARYWNKKSSPAPAQL